MNSAKGGEKSCSQPYKDPIELEFHQFYHLTLTGIRKVYSLPLPGSHLALRSQSESSRRLVKLLRLPWSFPKQSWQSPHLEYLFLLQANLNGRIMHWCQTCQTERAITSCLTFLSVLNSLRTSVSSPVEQTMRLSSCTVCCEDLNS